MTSDSASPTPMPCYADNPHETHEWGPIGDEMFVCAGVPDFAMSESPAPPDTEISPQGSSQYESEVQRDD